MDTKVQAYKQILHQGQRGSTILLVQRFPEGACGGWNDCSLEFPLQFARAAY
jgi:hypothetical protein